MNSFLVSCLLICGILAQLTDGFSTGAPPMAIVCSSRRPQHYGATFSSNTGGCSLSIQGLSAGSHYKPGQKYTVTISGCQLKGFILQCMDSTGPTGHFSTVAGDTKAKTFQCSSPDDTATHQNNIVTNQVNVQWTAPSGGCAQIQCKSTVVKSYLDIVTDVNSKTIGCAPTPTTPLPTTLPVCSTNQTLVGCGAVGCEGTCETPSPQACPEYCQINVCMCKNGFLRKSEGSCVRPIDCPGLCSENEQFNWCGTACEPTCDDPVPSICTDECIDSVCQCKQGYARSADNKCIPIGQCIATSPPVTTTVKATTTPLPTTPAQPTVAPVECPENEEFLSCGSACEPSCETPEPEFCTLECLVDVCQCQAGFVRTAAENGQKGRCVPKEECQVATQPPPPQPLSECPAIRGCASYGRTAVGACCPPCVRNISVCETSDVDCVVDGCTRYKSKFPKSSCCRTCARMGSAEKGTLCSSVLCPRGRTCEEVNGKPICRCKDSCHSNAPVCGSDGKTYASSCHLHLHVCRSCESVFLASNGPCPSVKP